jgi:hypothetical protein
MFAPLDTHLEIVAGDDYKAADGRALSWTSQMFPSNLAGATLSMVLGHNEYNLYGNLPITITGSVPGSPASPTTVSLDVAGAITANLPAGQYQYMLTATLTDGDRVTIAAGNLSMLAAPNTTPLYPPAV